MSTSSVPPVFPRMIIPSIRNEVPAENAEAEKVEPPPDTATMIQNSVQVVDETTASATQFINRRYLTDQLSDRTTLYEASLEDQPEMKAKIIERAATRQQLSNHDMLKFLTKTVTDDSDLIIILREMLRKRKMDEVARKKIKELLVLVEESVDKKAVYAGINCAIKAKLFGKEMALKPTYLRALYRNFLFSDKHPTDLYLELISQFGSKQRKMILIYLDSALSSDSKAMDASCSSVEFGEFLNKLTQLQLLQAAEQLFIKKLMCNRVIKGFNIAETKWVHFLLSMLMNPQGVESLINELIEENIKDASSPEISVLLVTIYNCLKSLPQGLFMDEGGVTELIEHFQMLFSNRLITGPENVLISP